jgi:anti-anti-sigma regulatory factor
MGTHSPPLTAAPPAGAGLSAAPVDILAVQAAPQSDLQRLNAVLDGRQGFHQAQGMLAEMAGCTLRRAGEVLLQHGAQLGLQTADAVAGFFLINAADAFGDPDSRAVVARFAALAAAGPDLDRIENPATPSFATMVAAGRTLEILGELDIATVPLLAAAFADRQPGTGPESSFRLNLHDLTFLDVAGLRALSDVEIQITDHGERLQVCLPTSSAANWMLRFAVAHGWIAPVFTGTAS